jgi:hypothetical protein
VLQPNTFPDLCTREHTLLAGGRRYEQIVHPFEWKVPAKTSTERYRGWTIRRRNCSHQLDTKRRSRPQTGGL